MKPQFYQEDCVEAFLLGLNTGLICATGSDKTEAFVLLLFADPERKSRIIIVFPLNALQSNHAKRFAKYEIPAAAVNGETYTDALHEQLSKEAIHAIIISPEMMFKHAQFSQFLWDPDWTKKELGVIIDEVHCVLEWGKEFRCDFDDVNKTRAYMVSKPLPLLHNNSTPLMVGQLLKKLLYPCQRRFILNLRCERHNVTPVICRIKGTLDYEALDFVLDKALSDPPKPLVSTLIYTEERVSVMNIWLHLMHRLPSDSSYQAQVEFLMATRDEIVKSIVLAKFLYGKVKILCSTEAAGMVSLPLFTFGVPQSLLQWQQHAGRAGRDENPLYAILLVEPSVFQVVKPIKKKQASLSGQVPEYCKHINKDMRLLCMTKTCRQVVTMKVFNSPPSMCTLEDLCFAFWKKHYGNTILTMMSILPDSILSTLASDARIVTMDDLKLLVPAWDFVEEMRPSVLAMIAQVD
ncbi:P-loop containing nucleoside triphosphate hydrolase protein, partial [Irpex rosettiformis]